MPDDDYHTPGGGLKLKGSKPSGIKKKKKKPSSSSTTTPSRETALQKAAAAGDDDNDASPKPSDEDESLRELEPRDPHDGKTPAEKAAEEMRRKRLGDKLAREGNKTHKERVEELNKYLSNLSEHHDMPRIGPG